MNQSIDAPAGQQFVEVEVFNGMSSHHSASKHASLGLLTTDTCLHAPCGAKEGSNQLSVGQIIAGIKKQWLRRVSIGILALRVGGDKLGRNRCRGGCILVGSFGGIASLASDFDLDSHSRIGPASSDCPSESARIGVDHIDEMTYLLPDLHLPVVVDDFIDRDFLNARFLALLPECRLNDDSVREASQSGTVQLSYLFDALEQNSLLDSDFDPKEESVIARLLLFLSLTISLRRPCCYLFLLLGWR